MANDLQEQLHQIVDRKNRATARDNLIWGYRLYALTEGKRQKTIAITTIAVTTFRDLLEAGHSLVRSHTPISDFFVVRREFIYIGNYFK